MDGRKRQEKRSHHNGEETQVVTHPFPAYYQKDSTILILGSFPSVKSREASFFYAHPQNRFWKILALIFGEKSPKTKEEKENFLQKHQIALWDVIHSCRIKGSSDSSIQDVVPNNLKEILENSSIAKIFCNGASSYKYYKKYQEKVLGKEATLLSSSSPANAAKSLEALLEIWKQEIL